MKVWQAEVPGDIILNSKPGMLSEVSGIGVRRHFIQSTRETRAA